LQVLNSLLQNRTSGDDDDATRPFPRDGARRNFAETQLHHRFSASS